ncbi:hypothetical protein ALC57_18721 [Trachymyrmex cornetzi]|uniref:Regulatory protein zeste n=1 Tax=Trachymyrmex cornetzi TaxID=471704 RepID=A0A151IRC5_9HYME|nr:hypothetical protein ALC57_18721 [Trachymyrmex cornetzi]
MWNVIAENINKANEGPEKNGQEWAKTWEDIKAYIFKKEAKRRSYAQGTGGGPPSKVSFSSFDEDVLQLLTPEAAGLENIPEGGLINIVEEVQPLQECDYQNTMQEQDIQCSVIETDEIENVSTNVNIRQHSRKNETVTQEKNTRKGKSVHQLSYNMLEIQEAKLKLKRKELKIRKKQLKVQTNILTELKEIKLSLQTQNGFAAETFEICEH